MKKAHKKAYSVQLIKCSAKRKEKYIVFIAAIVLSILTTSKDN